MPAIAVEKVTESAQFGVISKAEESMRAQYPSSLFLKLTPLAERLVGVNVISYSNDPSMAGCEVILYFSGWDPAENIGRKHLGLTGQEETRIDLIGVQPWRYVTERKLPPTPFEYNWEELHRLAERLHRLPADIPHSEHYEKFLQLFPPPPQNLAA